MSYFSGFSLCNITDKFVFAIGGRGAYFNQGVDSSVVPLGQSDRYDVANNKWEHIAGMAGPYLPATCAIGEIVYVFGGLEGKAMYASDSIMKLSDVMGPVEDIGIDYVQVGESGLSINACFNPAVTQLNHTEILVIGGQPN